LQVSRRGFLKSFCFSAALVALTALLCLVFSEVILRLTVYSFKEYPVSPGAGSTYHFKTAEFENVITTNSLNMRDGEIPPKREGEYRILCLGDSFTFGMGVNIPQSYPKVLEKILLEHNPRYRVINGGTGGSAFWAYSFLKEKGLDFRPDLVVVQVYIGNDFYDGMSRADFRAPAQPAAAVVPSRESPLHLFKVAVRGLKLRTPEFLWIQLTRVKWIDDLLYRMDLRYDNRAIYLRDYPALESRLVRMELEDLGRIKRACEEHQISMLVILVPEKQQVFQSRRLNDAKYDYRKPNRILKEFCGQNGLDYIDFLDVYKALPEKTLRSFYFSKDMHWTVKGHVFAAETIAKFLAQKFK